MREGSHITVGYNDVRGTIPPADYHTSRTAVAPPGASAVPNLASRFLSLALTAALTAQPAAIPVVRAQSQDLPSLGDAGGDDLSPGNERRLGEAIMREVRRDPDYMDDPDSTEYLNNLGFKLVAASPARYTDFGFFLVRDPMMNAFALPGGFIGVHSGLVLTAQSESELAAVLAHEIGHVSQRHIARMIAKQRDSGLIAIGALLLAILASRSGSSSSGQMTEAAIAAGQAAAIQQQLNFSRENEREADRVGFQILNDAGFDVTAMASFFTRLQQGSRIYESAAPAYLRTHPLTVERIADIQTRVRELKPHPHPDSLDFQLVRARLRVLQDDSVQGARDALDYFKGQLKNHSTPSEAAANYGAAVAALKLNQPAVAVEYAQTARKLARTPSAMLDKIVADARYAAAQSDAERADAVRVARDATVRFPISRLTAINYADLLQKSGQHEAAVAYLREQLALPKSEPQYYELLARSYAALDRKALQHQATAEMYLLQGSLPGAIDQLQSARKANDADFYVMSEIDARLRQLTQKLREQREELAKSGRAPPPEDNGKRR